MSKKESEELKELRKISKILTVANATSLEKEISKFATTNRRKMIWVLIDGANMPQDIMDKIHTTKVRRRTVYDFLEVLEQAKLIENTKGKPPSKLIDFNPVSWIELFKGKDHVEKDAKRKS